MADYNIQNTKDFWFSKRHNRIAPRHPEIMNLNTYDDTRAKLVNALGDGGWHTLSSLSIQRPKPIMGFSELMYMEVGGWRFLSSGLGCTSSSLRSNGWGGGGITKKKGILWGNSGP